MLNDFGCKIQATILMMLIAMTVHAQCITNKGDDLSVIVWTYEAMYVTYNINFTTTKVDYVKQALPYYSPDAWSKQYRQLEQQNIFATIQEKKGILLMGLPVQPVITDKVTGQWKILVKFDLKILSSSATETIQPVKSIMLTVKKDAQGCFSIDDLVDA